MEKKCGEWYPNTAKTSIFKFHYRQHPSGWRRYFVVLYISSTSNWCDRAIHVSCQRLMRDFASTVFAAECSEVKSGVAPQDGTKSGAIHDSMINLCLALWTGCHRLFLWLEKEANLYPNVTNQTLSRWTLRSAQAISGREVLVLPLSFLLFLYLRTTRQKAVRERTFRALGRDRIGEVEWLMLAWWLFGGCQCHPNTFISQGYWDSFVVSFIQTRCSACVLGQVYSLDFHLMTQAQPGVLAKRMAWEPLGCGNIYLRFPCSMNFKIVCCFRGYAKLGHFEVLDISKSHFLSWWHLRVLWASKDVFGYMKYA